MAAYSLLSTLSPGEVFWASSRHYATGLTLWRDRERVYVITPNGLEFISDRSFILPLLEDVK